MITNDYFSDIILLHTYRSRDLNSIYLNYSVLFPEHRFLQLFCRECKLRR